MKIRRLGIMRHGQQFRPEMDRRERPPPGQALTISACRDATAVARRLAEYVVEGINADEAIDLEEQPTQGDIAADSEGFDGRSDRELLDHIRILFAPSDAATQTAEIVARAIVLEACPDLDPESDSEKVFHRTQEICEPCQKLCPGRDGLRSEDMLEELGLNRPLYVIEVGHDPDLTKALHRETSHKQRWPIRRLSARTALRRGEVAMLKRTNNGGWEIEYVVSPGSKTEITQLQDKLKSKMDTAKLLGAFLTGLALFAGKAIIDHESVTSWYPWVAGLGLALLAFGVIAYMVTMFFYDSLLMPTEFWPTAGTPRSAEPAEAGHEGGVLNRHRWYRIVGTGQNPARPPSSAATVIVHSMQRVWGGMFVPATLCSAAGTVLIVIALGEPTGSAWWAVAGAIVAIAVAVAVLAEASRPTLGHSD